METLTIKRGDKHDVKLTIVNAPLDLTGATVKVLVTPSVGGTATTFLATLSGSTVTWALDGTLAAGKYKLEVEASVSGFVMTAPNDSYVELVVLKDLG